jgi:hypothetical protein
MIGSGRVDLTVRRMNSVAAGDTKMKENQDVRGGHLRLVAERLMRVVACEGAGEDVVGSASGDGAGLVVVAVVDGEGSGAGKVEPSPPPPHFSFFRPLSNTIGLGSSILSS